LERLVNTVQLVNDRKRDSITFRERNTTQDYFITFLFLVLGGTRRQIVASMCVDDIRGKSPVTGVYYLKVNPQKIALVGANQIPYPAFLQDLFDWYLKHIRPRFFIRDGVRAFWINSNGNALAHQRVTEKVEKVFQEVLPEVIDGKVCPLVVRRSAITEVMNNDSLALPGSDHESFVQYAAQILNSSVNVFKSNYLLVQPVQRHAQVIETINAQVFSNERTAALQDKLRKVVHPPHSTAAATSVTTAIIGGGSGESDDDDGHRTTTTTTATTAKKRKYYSVEEAPARIYGLDDIAVVISVDDDDNMEE
jgi:hypothetical protein